MNVYVADIWCGVYYHSGEFSHNAARMQLIHAMNEELARKKIKLSPERTMSEVRANAEFIYRLKKIGTVRIQPYYVYSDGRSPRPARNLKDERK